MKTKLHEKSVQVMIAAGRMDHKTGKILIGGRVYSTLESIPSVVTLSGTRSEVHRWIRRATKKNRYMTAWWPGEGSPVVYTRQSFPRVA